MSGTTKVAKFGSVCPDKPFHNGLILISYTILMTMYHHYCYIWVIPGPYQINKKILTLLDFHKIGTPTKKYSQTKNLAQFINLPLKYDHSNLKYPFFLHMFNKMGITLSVTVTGFFCLDFSTTSLNSLSGDI